MIAPALASVKAGDRVKTDQRDAKRLARSHRAGDLTPVWIPNARRKPCVIWCELARQPNRINCGRVIG